MEIGVLDVGDDVLDVGDDEDASSEVAEGRTRAGETGEVTRIRREQLPLMASERSTWKRGTGLPKELEMVKFTWILHISGMPVDRQA